MGQATFGEFLQSAHRHLAATPGPDQARSDRGSVEEVSRSLLRLVTIMGSYLRDIAGPLSGPPARKDPGLAPWLEASQQAKDAAQNAALYLIRHQQVSRWPTAPAVSPLARRLDAAAVSLAVGRDVLQTHLAVDPRGGARHRSEWGGVVTSAPVARALLAEIGQLAGRSAHPSANVALAPFPGASETEPRRRLSAACQWLWVLEASIRTARQRAPIPERDHELLRAIPLNVLPGRPAALTSVLSASDICGMVATAAERVRHQAWASAYRPPRTAEATALSLRQVADAATVTSHHCHLLFQALAAHSCQAGLNRLTEHLSEAAAAAAHARERWLRTGWTVRQITTATQTHSPALAEEVNGLALWSGRLAYADPAWTLASRPAHQACPPARLVARPHDLPHAIAAVHQACHTLNYLSRLEQDRIWAAVQIGQILVPTRSLPDCYDIPHPFAPAPHDRIELLLAHYSGAEQAARQATEAAERAADATGAPSRVLAAVRAAALGVRPAAGGDRAPLRAAQLAGREEETGGRAQLAVRPGPVESTLRHLGVTSHAVLARGADLDQAAERLIIGAAADLDAAQRRPDVIELNSSAGTTEVINHALASGDPGATGLLRRPKPPSRKPPEPEREP